MTTKNLLVELFVEELPPKALKKLGDAFAGVLFEQLKAQQAALAMAIIGVMPTPLLINTIGVFASVSSTKFPAGTRTRKLWPT